VQHIHNLNQLSSKQLALILLKLAFAGALIASVVVAPGLGVVYRHFKKAKYQEQKRLRKKLYDLKRAGYVARHKNGYSITEKGIQKLNEEEVWQLAPEPNTSKAGEWHIVLFDIPGKKERARQALRARLSELGFSLYQHSVYIHKHNLRNILEPFVEFYGIKSHVRFMVATHIK